MTVPQTPQPKMGDTFVIVHDVVGGWATQWYRNRVVLSDEYAQHDPLHPEWDVTAEQLQRLADLGAARLASTDERSAAIAAKNAAVAAGEEWTGYYLPEEVAT